MLNMCHVKNPQLRQPYLGISTILQSGSTKMSAEGQIARGRTGESTLQGPPSESLSQQYSLAKLLGIWAAAALPMAAPAWVVAPGAAGLLAGPVALTRAVLVSLTVA